MKITNPIPQKPKHGKGSVHNDENTCYRCFLTTKLEKQDKEKDTTTMNSKASMQKGGKQSLKDQLYLLVGFKKKSPEKYIL